MDNHSDLTAVRIPDDEVDFYRVKEGGWYAVDDDDKAVLGPFESLGECDRAIHDRVALAAPSESPATRANLHS
jgi:hypothetical protein